MGKAVIEAGTPSVKWLTVPELAPLYLPHRSEGADQILLAYGRAMMAWNMLEGIVRLVLEVLLEEDGTTGRASMLATTAELSGLGLETAVSSLAPHVLDEARAADIAFSIRCVGLLRGYRNYYAHGLSWVSTYRGETTAPITTWSARRSIRQHTDKITASDLDVFAMRCAEFAAYMKATIEALYPVTLNGEGPPEPERPTAPPECKKATAPLAFRGRAQMPGPGAQP